MPWSLTLIRLSKHSYMYPHLYSSLSEGPFVQVLMVTLHRALFEFNAQSAMASAMYWPVARCPVFFMGVLAGLLRSVDMPSAPYAFSRLLRLVSPMTDSDRQSPTWYDKPVLIYGLHVQLH